MPEQWLYECCSAAAAAAATCAAQLLLLLTLLSLLMLLLMLLLILLLHCLLCFCCLHAQAVACTCNCQHPSAPFIPDLSAHDGQFVSSSQPAAIAEAESIGST